MKDQTEREVKFEKLLLATNDADLINAWADLKEEIQIMLRDAFLLR